MNIDSGGDAPFRVIEHIRATTAAPPVKTYAEKRTKEEEAQRAEMNGKAERDAARSQALALKNGRDSGLRAVPPAAAAAAPAHR